MSNSLTPKQKKAILKLCRDYAPQGMTSILRNLGNDIIAYLEAEAKDEQ